MMQLSVALELRHLARELRQRAAAGAGLSAGETDRIAAILASAGRSLDVVEARAAEAEELEDELLIVAGDPTRGAEPAPSFQAALKAQQAEIQRRLDGGGAEPVSRRGLATLSVAIGDSNVVTFPCAPRHSPVGDGGDAA